MLPGDSIALVIGVTIAMLLLATGFALGKRFARRRGGQAHDDPIDQRDREHVLRLLQDLGSWTSEYSGNVSEYQSQLGQINEAVRNNSGQPNSEHRVVLLLQQIMQTNEQLQTRLDAAERQLEKQTRQIECYLTEARTDGLTGLFNRRAFDQRLEELFVAYRGGGRSFVVVLIDIDRFKSINDTHGHQAGDRVLQQLSRTMRIELDQASIVARFGGEEFAAIMDGPLRIAANKMNEVRKQIANEILTADDCQLKVTVSIGLSEPREDLVVSPILRRADESLYAAKNMGRNRVYYHDGRGPTLVGAPEVARNTGET
jgi:diguanylate cyclase